MGSKDIGALRDEMIGHLRNANAVGRMSEERWGTGRGLVFTAGNAVSSLYTHRQFSASSLRRRKGHLLARPPFAQTPSQTPQLSTAIGGFQLSR